jgi:pyrroline-5-carboxylate reductase
MLPSLLLAGFGRMGAALAAGWREQGLAASFAVDPAATPAASCDLSLVAGLEALPPDFAPLAVILAVKPQVAPDILPLYARFAGAVFLSIMAGRSVSFLRGALGERAAVVRAMPNTPAAIRQGFSVACAGPGVSAAQRALCDTLLRAVGEVAWVTDEALLDPVTAVSGGGPAYVFLLAELLEQAAIGQGIPADLAARMARQTVAGSGALLAASAESPAALRRAVTSPAGTTERALSVLMEAGAWPAAMNRAIEAATARSRELAGPPQRPG